MSAPLFRLNVRAKRYGAVEVLRDVRLEVAQGEIVALVGPSGCGKSTLLRVAAGLDRDVEGQVEIGGERVSGPTRAIRFVFQEPRLFPWLTVARNVAFDVESAAPDRARVEALLAEVGLEGLGDRLPKQLSGGQAQRVALARSLYARPRLLLLDEPFSAVDAFTRIRLQALAREVARAHDAAVILVTHDVEEAVRLGSRVIVFDSEPGRISREIGITPEARNDDDPAHVAAVREVRHALGAVHAF